MDIDGLIKVGIKVYAAVFGLLVLLALILTIVWFILVIKEKVSKLVKPAPTDYSGLFEEDGLFSKDVVEWSEDFDYGDDEDDEDDDYDDGTGGYTTTEEGSVIFPASSFSEEDELRDDEEDTVFVNGEVQDEKGILADDMVYNPETGEYELRPKSE